MVFRIENGGEYIKYVGFVAFEFLGISQLSLVIGYAYQVSTS